MTMNCFCAFSFPKNSRFMSSNKGRKIRWYAVPVEPWGRVAGTFREMERQEVAAGNKLLLPFPISRQEEYIPFVSLWLQPQQMKKRRAFQIYAANGLIKYAR